MTPEELDDFLGTERTCRVATVSVDGRPHQTALWFLWDGRSLWLNSLVRSQRWRDLERDPRISVIVDAGQDYVELRGVELTGQVVQVGEAPRVGDEVNDELAEIEPRYARKYRGLDEPAHDGRHAWLKLIPSAIVSWDFRKLTGARAQQPSGGASREATSKPQGENAIGGTAREGKA
jgi:PPOX class probable F420-dependent enzyme